ncbi:MAG: metallophosphoesterase [Phycisphaerae bacterium]
MNRREFLVAAGAAAVATVAPKATLAAEAKTFRLWATGCAHVGTDKRHKRESLADAIRQSEDAHGGFGWNVALHVGDISGNQGFPDDREGREIVRQFRVLRKHRLEQFYCLGGNHDADSEYRWFRTWIDPTGENTRHSGVNSARRPYPVEGTWERYSFRVGNLLFLMMSDRNDLELPIGRGRSGARGGYPAGAVTGETFAWWKKMVEANKDSIIISAHHHMLKDTTVGSGQWEGTGRPPGKGQVPKGVRREKYNFRYHGYFPRGAPQGASYLYFVDGKPNAQAFEGYLAQHPNAIDLWIGGHTHTCPDDSLNGRTHIERKWDVNFINCCALTRYHGGRCPMSRLLTFTEGSDAVRVELCLHTNQFAARGFCGKFERTLKLSRRLRLTP